MEELEIDIGDLKNAYTHLIEALNDISEVEGIDEEQYKMLNQIAEEIDDLRREKENKLEELQEEEETEENRELWDRDYRTLEDEYWRSQF